MIRSFIKRIQNVSKKAWPQGVSLSLLLTLTCVTAVIGASLTGGYFALSVIRENKFIDTWAIMFLELEHEASDLAGRLSQLSKGLDQAAGEDDVVFAIDKDGALLPTRGNIPGVSRLSDMKLDYKADGPLPPRTSVVDYSGQKYLAWLHPDLTQLHLRKVLTHHFAVESTRSADDGSLYLITREGKLLYSNDAAITELNLTDRDLVQKFIRMPVKQGQFEFVNKNGSDMFGFFAEVPHSNMIVFSEVDKERALAVIRKLMKHFFLILAAITAGVILILQIPLSRITGPVKELVQLTQIIASGRFDVKPSQKAVGEIGVLSRAIGAMSSRLQERDLEIAALTREQLVKNRLSSEMAIAKRIQENLLPAANLPKESGLSLGAAYLSADECAGDWYHFSYDPKSQETVMVIADVSGHGAGASIFTAVIATVFDQVKGQNHPTFPIDDFVHMVNSSIFRLGKNEWHATMFVARYGADKKTLDYINVGHPSPFLKNSQGIQTLPNGSDSVLGLASQLTVTIQSVVVESNNSLLMYTDGFIEAQRPDGRRFGRKRARNLLANSATPARNPLGNTMDRWASFLQGQKIQDDVCVVMLRVA